VRIMCAAHGGQVLLSHTTAALVEAHLPEQLQLRDLGFHRLRDLHWHTHLFQLIIDGLPAEFPAPKTLESHPNNLPSQPTAFLGREHDFTRLRTLLLREEVRLVTLTGPAGVGKTRLALQLGAELIEGRYPAIRVTSPNQAGGTRIDSAEVWILTAPSAIRLIGASLSKRVRYRFLKEAHF